MFNIYPNFGKRTFDVAAATLGTLALTPLLFVLAIAVRLSSKGPIIYKQERIGLGFKPFTMYKFRSMVVNDPQSHQLVTAAGDHRITPIGSFLRRYKLDELPQLINVIKGDMSLVGPRPRSYEIY